MSELNPQDQYDSQDQQANKQSGEKKSNCLSCCCDYLKWSAKSACKIFTCVGECM